MLKPSSQNPDLGGILTSSSQSQIPNICFLRYRILTSRDFSPIHPVDYKIQF